MPRWWPPVIPVFNDAAICTTYIGPPAFGPVLPTNQARILLGWDHALDDPTELRHGQIYCWVSKDLGRPKFQCFRTSGNRSNVPGQRVDCGVVNYSMVRMIHPYWAENGVVPRDMAWKPDYDDKARLRALYHRLVRERNGDNDDEEDFNGGGLDDPDLLPLFIEQGGPEDHRAREWGGGSDGPQVDNMTNANMKRKRKAPEAPKTPRKPLERIWRRPILDNEEENLVGPNNHILEIQDDEDDVKHPHGYFDSNSPGTLRNPFEFDLVDDFQQISEETQRATNALGSGARANTIDLTPTSTQSRTQTEEPLTSLFGNGITNIEADARSNRTIIKADQEQENLIIPESQVVNLQGNEVIPLTPRAQDALVTDEIHDAQISEHVPDSGSNDATLVHGQDMVFIGEDARLDSTTSTIGVSVTDNQAGPIDLDD